VSLDSYGSRRQIYDAFYDVIVDGLRSHEFHSPLAPGILSNCLIQMISSSQAWYKPDGALTSTEIGTYLAELTLGGLLTDQGRQPWVSSKPQRSHAAATRKSDIDYKTEPAVGAVRTRRRSKYGVKTPTVSPNNCSAYPPQIHTSLHPLAYLYRLSTSPVPCSARPGPRGSYANREYRPSWPGSRRPLSRDPGVVDTAAKRRGEAVFCVGIGTSWRTSLVLLSAMPVAAAVLT
jgi:hypothetical protein